jgi:PAS domain S-box-containing protein
LVEQANLTAAVMLNVERQQLIGRKFSDFVNDESQDMWHLHRRKVFAEPKTLACELLMATDVGASASFRMQSLAFRDDLGNLSSCRSAIADVSDRRIAFEALSQLNINLDELLSDKSDRLDRSIELLRLLSEAVAHLGEGVMITGDNLDWPGPEILFVNEAMCRIAGYEANELIGKSPRVLQGEATCPEALERMRHDLKDGGTCLVELVNYRKDGTAYDVEIFVTPLFDASGKRTNFVSIQRDITERKRIANESRREHEFNQMIINTSQNVTLVLDTEGRIVEFNPYLEKITGWRFEEVNGRDWFEIFVPPSERQSIRRMFAKALTGDSTKGFVNRVITKDGQSRYIQWFDCPLKDSDDQLIGLLSTGQDMTERRELERHVVEIAAEERRRIGTDLHDGVGQELTGLSMIAESLAISLSRASRPEVKIAEKIKTGLLRTLVQVRTLSRGLNPVDVDAEGLMSALSEMSSQLNQLTGIRCSFQCDQPVLLRDNETATQLFRIAQEATTNAIRHGQPDKITISVERCDHHVILRITDNGNGIGTSDSQSSGMGLRTMAYRARMIQGQLEVRPIPTGGTEVVCLILDNT